MPKVSVSISIYNTKLKYSKDVTQSIFTYTYHL